MPDLRVWRMAVCLAVASACFDSQSMICAELTCPAGKVCAPAGNRCVLAEQVTACSASAEGEPCSFAGSTASRCIGGVCTPVGCGNGILESGEVCDDANVVSGDGCSADCLSTEACGNAITDPAANEACDCGDGSQPLQPGCTQPNGNAAGATCTLDCTLHGCGDGLIAVPEQCEGPDLNGLTCGDLGYYGGTLACTPLCLLDVTGCSERCGDDVRNGTETCDGTDFGSDDCTTYGFYFASGLACNAGCGVDLSGCTGYCGDGTKNGMEPCEGAPPDGLQCIDFGYDVGRITCSQLCAPDFSGCGYEGWINQLSTTGTLRGIWAAGEHDVYAVGDDGLVLHYDGTAWDTLSLGTTTHLHAVGGSAANDIYIAGESSFARHWDGATWSPISIFPAVAARITSLYALSSTTAFAVNAAGDIARLSGGNWIVDYDGGAQLGSVWARNATDIWAVGISTVLHSTDGTTWAPETTGGSFFQSVVGVDAGDVYVTAFSSVNHWNGLSWTSSTSESANALVAKGDLAVGAYSLGPITRVPNGHDWTRMVPSRNATAFTPPLLGRDSAGHFWFAGASSGTSVIKKFSGSAWSSIFSTTVTALWGENANKVFGVALTNCYRYDGGLGFAVTTTNCSPQNLHAIWGTTALDVYAVGNAGAVTSYDGNNWTATTAGTQNLYGVWGSGGSVYAVGASGTVQRSTGGAWSPVTVPAITDDLLAVWGPDTNNIFVVGTTGRLLRYASSQWTTSQISTRDLRAIWGTSPSDVWAVGDQGTIVHFNGTTWSTVVSGTTLRLRALWGTAPNDVFAAGDNNTLLHFDGTAWSPVRVYSTLGGNITSIWGDGRRVYFGGLFESLDRVAFPPSACTTSEATCADAADNDCDFLLDCADPDCRSATACN